MKPTSATDQNTEIQSSCDIILFERTPRYFKGVLYTGQNAQELRDFLTKETNAGFELCEGETSDVLYIDYLGSRIRYNLIPNQVYITVGEGKNIRLLDVHDVNNFEYRVVKHNEWQTIAKRRLKLIEKAKKAST